MRMPRRVKHVPGSGRWTWAQMRASKRGRVRLRLLDRWWKVQPLPPIDPEKLKKLMAELMDAVQITAKINRPYDTTWTP